MNAYSPKEWSETGERILRGAFNWGRALFVLSGLVKLAIIFGLIRKNAFHGYAEDGASVVFVVSIGLIFIGTWTAISRYIGSVKRSFADSRQKRKASEEQMELLWDNISLVSDDAKVLLLGYIREHKNGRFIAPDENSLFDELRNRDLIEQEASGIRHGYIALSYTGQIWRVNPSIFALKEIAVEELEKYLARHYAENLKDREALKRLHISLIGLHQTSRV